MKFERDYDSHIRFKRLLTFAIVFAVLAGAFGAFQSYRYLQFRRLTEGQYQRAFSDLAQSVTNINLTLTKLMVTNNKDQVASLSADLWREAAFAKANIGQLPISNTKLDNTSNFLTQVGDYTYALSKKVVSTDRTLSDAENRQLAQLLKYSNTLNADLQTMQSQIMDGQLRLVDNSDAVATVFATKSNSLGNNFESIENKFSDYVSLIYDGPFSQNNLNKKAVRLDNESIVSKNDAAKIAKAFIPGDNVKSMSVTGEGNGNIPAYECKAKVDDDKREITVQVTKHGGHVLQLTDNRNVKENKLSLSDASNKAYDFLAKKGIKDMLETGYINSNNSIDFAFAYKKDDYIIYPDLIKVKIALDTGEMVGYEASNYLINHNLNIALPHNIVSVDQAKAKIKKQLSVIGVNKSLIPLETGENVFCYEFKVNYDKKTFLIYINMQNLREEKILMMVDSERGSLTI